LPYFSQIDSAFHHGRNALFYDGPVNVNASNDSAAFTGWPVGGGVDKVKFSPVVDAVTLGINYHVNRDHEALK